MNTHAPINWCKGFMYYEPNILDTILKNCNPNYSFFRKTGMLNFSANGQLTFVLRCSIKRKTYSVRLNSEEYKLTGSAKRENHKTGGRQFQKKLGVLKGIHLSGRRVRGNPVHSRRDADVAAFHPEIETLPILKL